MLFSLFLANIRIVSCFFFLFLVTLSNFLIISVVKEKIKVKLASAILTGTPTTLTEEIMQTTALAVKQEKQLKLYLCNQKHEYSCLIFYCMIFFD